MSFHDVRFPLEIARSATGGPERRTDVVVLGSGHEERNTRWADSRRVYDAGYGIKTLNDLNAVIAFFEERRGRLHAFRWRDPTDWKSCPPEDDPTQLDQIIGTGDGETDEFQLKKVYGNTHLPWSRTISKPV
ncbi:MAG: phage distal tail protein, Rcc01695 family, partial [Hyphomicrobiaceae bacterium]